MFMMDPSADRALCFTGQDDEALAAWASFEAHVADALAVTR